MTKASNEWNKKNRIACNEACRRWRLKNDRHFGGLKHLVLERDNNRCRFCSMSNDEHKKRYRVSITIDHIDRNRKNNTMENRQTLCLKCHGAKDNPKKSPLKIEEIYCKSCHSQENIVQNQIKHSKFICRKCYNEYHKNYQKKYRSL